MIVIRKSLLLLVLVISIQVKAQITFEKTYTKGTSGGLNWWYTKFSPTKTKYIFFNDVTQQFTIFNQDHSIYKTVNVPTQSGAFGTDWRIDNHEELSSEILFNADTLFEYVIYRLMPSTSFYYFKVYSETGTVIFQEDSVFGGGSGGRMTFSSPAGIKLTLYRPTSTMNTMVSVYGLGGTFLGNKPNNLSEKDFNLYPNPSQEFFKLDYTLPEEMNEATMEIYDIKGTLVRSYRISNQFTDILVETGSFSPGSYMVKISNGNYVISKKYIKM